MTQELARLSPPTCYPLNFLFCTLIKHPNKSNIRETRLIGLTFPGCSPSLPEGPGGRNLKQQSHHVRGQVHRTVNQCIHASTVSILYYLAYPSQGLAPPMVGRSSHLSIVKTVHMSKPTVDASQIQAVSHFDPFPGDFTLCPVDNPGQPSPCYFQMGAFGPRDICAW